MENRVDRAGLSLRVMWVLLVIFAGYLSDSAENLAVQGEDE